MLVNMKEMLLKAKAGKYAVPATNIDNEHNARAAIAAAEEKHSPIILNVTPVANPDIVYFGRILTDLAVRSSATICLNLDHGKTFEDCVRGFRGGFTNIMIDASIDPIEENIAKTKEMVKICHAVGVSVEAELGHVGVGQNYDVDGHTAFTDPKDAKRFVEETGCDALAVAIGTAHGAYKGTPEIHFDILKDITDTIDTPLVLHGGSGSGDENLAKCARNGICKINLSNDLKKSSVAQLQSHSLEGNGAYHIYEYIYDGFKEKIEYFMDLLGSAGKDE